MKSNTYKNMKTISLLFIISLFINGVVTDDTESVSVIEGDSVTLHTDDELKSHDIISWRYEGELIAFIECAINQTIVHNGTDGRFYKKLKINNMTGDITIKNIKNRQTGFYLLEIKRGFDKTTHSFHILALSIVDIDEVKNVLAMKKDSVTLHADVPTIKKYDVIRWLYENSFLAKLIRKNGSCLYSKSDTLRSRLQVDNQTGSLTIKNITTQHSGLYEVEITSSKKHTIHQSFSVNVSGEVKSVSVTEGHSVTLHTDTAIQTYDVMKWLFGDGTWIAEIYQPDSAFELYNKERFRDRLKMNPQTGSLTITNITTQHTGLYQLKISSSRRSIHREFNVTVKGDSSGDSSGVIAVICVSLLVLVIAAVGVGYRFFRRRRMNRQGQEISPRTQMSL